MGHNPTREQAVRRAMMPQQSKARTGPMGLDQITDERRIIRLSRRIRYLPTQIETARAKVRQLEAEARELGMHDLLVSNDQ